MKHTPILQKVRQNLKKVSLTIAIVTAVTAICTLQMACNRPDEAAKARARGLSSAKMAVRYLYDLEKMMLDRDELDAQAFDRKWKWAWQEIEEAEKAGFDKDITENLRCSHTAFAVLVAGGPIGAKHSCLATANRLLNERYGKEAR